MNISNKRALFTCIIFGALFVFLILYFAIAGPDVFLVNKIHFVINSAVVGIGLISFGLMMLFTHKKENIIDERDNYVQKKSYGTGLVLSLIYVFFISIILFIINRNNGVVTVSWLWFIGYSTFAFSYFITSLIILYYYSRE